MSRLFGTLLASAVASATLLGAAPALAGVTQLVYTPLAQPCRLLDTRTPGPGPVSAAHGPYTFGFTDTDISSTAQNGNVQGCGVPDGAYAISVNFNIFNATAAGNVTTWPTDGVAPAAGTAVYNPSVLAPSPGQVDYNTGFATIQGGTGDPHFNLALANGRADMTINVVGYWSALATGASLSEGAVNIGSDNSTTGLYSTAIGHRNTVSGDSAQAFGFQNVSAGWLSAALGSDNTADGDYAIAIGNSANSNGHSNGFVLGDGSAQTSNTADHQFLVRAKGGVVLYTSSSNVGAQLAPGSGSWTALSDRNAKDGVTAIDSRDVLQRVVAMPLTTWHYTTQDAKYRHMGPMAQDFYAAFGLGESDTGIDTIDADGVALAAIQGLNAKLEAQRSEHAGALAERDREIAELRAQVTALSAAIKRQVDAMSD